MESEEYQKGRDAFDAGLYLGDNPYILTDYTGACRDWFRGYCDAFQDDF